MAETPRPGPSAAAFIPEVKHTVAVSSGKGGVGKSTVAVNLALALKQKGHAVGLVDVDVYGPDVPLMMGTKGRPAMFDNKILPIEAHGIKIMSIGLLVDAREALVWRGPMIHSAVQQFLRDVNWGPLDYLVFDMPPGTGDAQLTLAQNVPLKGAIIISTPQDLSLIDARRGLAMFKKVNVPVLGIVENMSYFQCPHCGTRSDIFGHGGARHEAERLGVPFLGEIPLHMAIRVTSDAGNPVVVSEPDGPHANIFRAIGAKVRDQLQGVIAAA
jgi:ATP-binding protein involved in chromosome partitioning